MIWIVTTEEEARTICHGQGVKDLGSVFVSVGVVFSRTPADLPCFRHDDIVLTRTKQKWLVDALVYFTQNVGRRIGETADVYDYDLNKEKLKAAMRHYHVKTPQSFTADTLPGEPFDVFVKPLSWGDSLGIDSDSHCHTKAEVMRKLAAIKQYGPSMIEEYVDGYDCTVGVIKNEEGYYTAGLVIESPKGFLDYDTKENDSETYRPLNSQAVEDLALEVFNIIGATSYGRIDFRVNSQGEPYVLEVNLCPGLSRTGYMSMAFSQKGYRYEDMIRMIFK